ncbi:hypothetical protein [Desulfoluna spongiiphila]|uniref:Phage XkdN-like tail assembly chaperone protein, TAC n=1 Tax=Desulfoluna spongiiphila TaxID=419481 RepID=A0A1G5FZR1_9BACT|nr:hypothetical protein [Desulfoluna spongiiphila]SCY44694.1 hypothetical protein SAMN05216233_109109 [Desulfoluna spongiiphila]
MSFDVKKFKKTKFQTRTEDVPVKDLSAYFEEGENPVWVVRGLTGQELGQTKEAAARNKNFAAILEAIEASTKNEKVQGLKKALGVDEVPQNIAERIEQLVLGSVEPACDTDLALMLCERFPVEFYTLTNKILELTGKGMEPGKPKGSGAMEASGQA